MPGANLAKGDSEWAMEAMQHKGMVFIQSEQVPLLENQKF